MARHTTAPHDTSGGGAAAGTGVGSVQEGTSAMTTRGPDRRFFDIWSLGYDLELPQRLAYRPVHDAVLREMGGGSRPRRILDVGCGTGELVGRMRAAFPQAAVVGCDFSPGMLRRATDKQSGADWVRGDAGRLPFRAGSFDAITTTEAFHWFPDQDLALREFHRVLAPGGQLLLALATPPIPWLGRLAQVGSRLAGQPFYWPDRNETRRLLQRAGFEVHSQRRVFRFPGLLLLPMLTCARRPPGPRPPRSNASPRQPQRKRPSSARAQQ